MFTGRRLVGASCSRAHPRSGCRHTANRFRSSLKGCYIQLIQCSNWDTFSCVSNWIVSYFADRGRLVLRSPSEKAAQARPKAERTSRTRLRPKSTRLKLTGIACYRLIIGPRIRHKIRALLRREFCVPRTVGAASQRRLSVPALEPSNSSNRDEIGHNRIPIEFPSNWPKNRPKLGHPDPRALSQNLHSLAHCQDCDVNLHKLRTKWTRFSPQTWVGSDSVRKSVYNLCTKQRSRPVFRASKSTKTPENVQLSCT